MAKCSNKQQVDITNIIPDEINALRAIVKDFNDRMQIIDNELQTLHDDKNVLVEDADKIEARLGEKNNLSVPQDIDHWMRDVNQLLDGASKEH